VSRDDLRRLLWPADTFVDFDRGLNKAICALRTTLHDSALKPMFIETIPRRGYRFIGAVETAGATSPSDRVRDSSSARRIESLAVLPLANHSGDRSDEYFSDGMTEELITAVSCIRSLRVISRTSVMRYKETRKSLTAIARELSVDAVVEGSIARSDGKVRVTAQLIFAPEDRHIWSGRFEREVCGVLELQAEIAQSIASQIHRILEPRHASRALGGCTRRHTKPA
jgi:TolB-like protein